MNLLRIGRDVENLKQEIKALRPSYSPGALTNYTTRGVTRTVLPQPSSGNISNITNRTTPRWQ